MEAEPRVWWLIRGAEKTGPFSRTELKTRAATGGVLATDHIWKDGLQNPVPAASVKGLLPAQPPAPARPAAPPSAPSPVAAPPRPEAGGDNNPYRAPTAAVIDHGIPPEGSGILVRVEYAGLERQQLYMRTATFFGGTKLFLNGTQLKPKKNTYSITDDNGLPLSIKLVRKFIDPIPALKINGEKITVIEPLAWYEDVWASLPILMVFAGGFLGALFGVFATTRNGVIFRSERSSFMKYLLSGGITLSTFVIFIIFAAAIGLATHQGQH